MREDPEVRTLDLSARFVLREIISLLGKGGSGKEVPELLVRDPEQARARFDHIRRRLAEAGIIVESDEDESFQIYQSHREDWEPMLNRFAFYTEIQSNR
jgi:hypothetical protein